MTAPDDGDLADFFHQVYLDAAQQTRRIPWDRDGRPNPLLVEWLDRHAVDGHGRSALVVGCGTGSDAEQLAARGFATTAFDFAPSAIETARRRHRGSPVHYTVADVLQPPAEWLGRFDLVLESLTVQSIPVAHHVDAAVRIGRLVAPAGTLLVLAVHRDDGPPPEGPPWPLTRSEVDAFSAGDLVVRRLELLDRPGDVLERWWRAELYRPPAAG